MGSASVLIVVVYELLLHLRTLCVMCKQWIRKKDERRKPGMNDPSQRESILITQLVAVASEEDSFHGIT